MKKVFLLFLCLLFLASCSEEDVIHNKKLENSFETAIEKENVSEINLNKITSFNWGKAYIIAPYSSEKNIEKQLGTQFKDHSNINRRDDIYLIVFLDQNKAIQYVEVPTKFGNLQTKSNFELTPSHAKIKIGKK